MIKDKLVNSETYYNISKSMKNGFEWLKTQNLQSLPDGKYIIDEKIYANVQTYTTKENAPFEAHRKYIDIQYMVKGEEYIDVTDYQDCKTTIEYDEEKDIEFLESYKEADRELLCEGYFLVLFPQDAHKPSLTVNQKNIVKKVVVKICI